MGDPQVKALVCIAAFMPDQGEPLGVLAAEFPGSQLQPALQPTPFAHRRHRRHRPVRQSGGFRTVLAADVAAAQAAVMAAEQRPVSASVFGDVPTAVAWHTIPSWALVATQDEALGAPLEQFEAQRAHSHVMDVDSSHLAIVSHSSRSPT